MLVRVRLRKYIYMLYMANYSCQLMERFEERLSEISGTLLQRRRPSPRYPQPIDP
jgi:hypothetical protein